MFDKFLEKRKAKKENKRKNRPGKLTKLTANGEPVAAYNIHIFSEEKDGIFRIITPKETPSLHFDEISFIIETSEKKMKLKANFRNATQEKRYYSYDFVISDFKEFFA